MAFVGGVSVGRRGVEVGRSCSQNAQNGSARVAKRSLLRMAADFDDIASQLANEFQVSGSPIKAEAQSSPPTVEEGEGGLKVIEMEHVESRQTCSIYTFGATVQSWKMGNYEVFFTSEEAAYNGKKAIRAGIPICFPQFGPYGDLPTHGFARITDWEVKTLDVLEDGSTYAELGISSDTPSDMIAEWSGDKKWEATYAVTLSNTGLETALRVKNTGSEPIEFTAAFHNYFQVCDVKNVLIYGLDKNQYKDRLDGDKVLDEPDDMGQGVKITEETDRIYMNLRESDMAIFDVGSLALVKIKRTPTLPDSTLWNPFGSEGCDEGWPNFVCVEPAVIAKPAVVAPGEEWVGAQLLALEV